MQQLQQAGLPHTGQRLASRSRLRGSHFRILQVTEFVAGARSLGLDAVHHGFCHKQAISVAALYHLYHHCTLEPPSLLLLPFAKVSFVAIRGGEAQLV